MIQIEVIVKPCPWCKTTPELWLPIDDKRNTGGTWQWKIICMNSKCKIKPFSPYVAIRKSTKTDVSRLTEKLNQLCHFWNDGNDLKPYEKRFVNLDKIFK